MSRGNPRWSDFAVKTKQSIHDQFEDLCRMLFCDELNIKQGSLTR